MVTRFYWHDKYLCICQLFLKVWACFISIAQAETKMQQQLGGLHCQVDTLQAKVCEADAKERMFQAKLENAQHEVCQQQIYFSRKFQEMYLLCEFVLSDDVMLQALIEWLSVC